MGRAGHTSGAAEAVRLHRAFSEPPCIARRTAVPGPPLHTGRPPFPPTPPCTQCVRTRSTGRHFLEEVPSSSQCGSTPAFQFKTILRREFHSIRTGCTHRTSLVCAYHDLRHMPAAIRAVPQAQPHCQLARYSPSMPPCHPLMYTPSPLSPREV